MTVMDDDATVIQRALISVSDKTDLLEFAEGLHLQGIEIISTGGTASALKKHGIPVIEVSNYTKQPELMSGRLKTLHPKIHGGILGRRDLDANEMLEHNIPDIDLVVVNLYPFRKFSENPQCSLTDVIENIDIGGPTLIRGGAKNFAWCTTVVDPSDYMTILEALKQTGAINQNLRFKLAAKAFAHTASYDGVIANYFSKYIANQNNQDFGETFNTSYKLAANLRYGENPHQQAAFYIDEQAPSDSIAKTKQLQGKQLSFNNINDANSALECVKSFQQPCCVIVKHATPCGVAVSESIQQAYEKAFASDPQSAYGGIIAVNQEVNADLVEVIFNKQFVEVIIAPDFSEKALLFARNKSNCRLIQYSAKLPAQNNGFDIKRVNGGVLLQTWDKTIIDQQNCKVVTKLQPSQSELNDMLFANQVCKHTKSNAIVYAKAGQTIGIGQGQTSRVFSTEIAALRAKQAGFDLNSAVMASDAFLPFKDNVEMAHKYGIKAIIQPGGSKRDDEVIAKADELGISMVFTNYRNFKH